MNQYKGSTNVFLLFAPASVHEAGPLEAGLLAAHPEHRGDSHHQHHQILNEEENCSWMAGLLHLRGEEKDGSWIRSTRNQTEGIEQILPELLLEKQLILIARGRSEWSLWATEEPQAVQLLNCSGTLSNATSRGQQFTALL